MRPYPVVDDEPNDESYARVIPIRSAPRGRTQTIQGRRSRREPWMPIETDARPLLRRAEPAPRPESAPALQSSLSLTHRWMLAVFFLVCGLMIMTMVAWRLLSNDERPPAAPVDRSVPAAQPIAPAAPPPPPQPTAPPTPAAPPGTGPIVTEIRVLQPNYTVAPGDTLASIARRHGTTIEALASINNLENRNSLSVGQKLIIP